MKEKAKKPEKRVGGHGKAGSHGPSYRNDTACPIRPTLPFLRDDSVYPIRVRVLVL